MTYEVNEKQKKLIAKWLKSLHRSKKPYIGRDVSYTFSHCGGIGIALVVTDLKSGKTKDFTDMDSW